MPVSVQRLTRAESTVLDFARGVAALVVFLGHFRPYGYAMPLPGELAHDAVIVFFVLSGYLIAYSTFRKPTDWRSYLVARVSRLYSVIVHALVITAVLAAVGAALSPDFYHAVDKGHNGLRLALTALCMQETWWWNSSPPTNQPFWSLAYEFWYYVLFGLAVFIPGKIAKGFAILLACLLVGPKILLLAPIWIFGALACVLSGKFRFSPRICLPVASVLLVLWLLGVGCLPRLPHDVAPPPLFNSSAFLTDSILGFVFAALLLFLHGGISAWQPSAWLHDGIRWFADRTFSLYLLHLPLIFFITAVFNPARGSYPVMGLMVAGILGIVFLVAEITELRRPWFANLLRKLPGLKEGSAAS
jgi:peptidoglycan/LPS O-acetylase OafA/YrhL